MRSNGDLVVCILQRSRHDEIIAKTREAGARIMLITDGDVAGVIATSRQETGVDLYMGIGGAPEGVLAAAALALHWRPVSGPSCFSLKKMKKPAPNAWESKT